MTDKLIPASKLLALKDYWDERMGCMTVRSDDIHALIDSQPTAAEIAPILEHLIDRYESLVHDLYDGTHKLEKLLEDAQPAREMLIRLKETPHG